MKNKQIITFSQFKKLLTESFNSIYDKYEELLCDVFDVDNISEISKEIYENLMWDYETNRLNEHDSYALEKAAILVHKVARENGFNLVAHHGTTKEFSEFKYGDLGFHFGTEEQAKNAARLHADASDNIIYLDTVLSLHNPLFIETDLGNWYPIEITHGALCGMLDFISNIQSKINNIDLDEINDLNSGLKLIENDEFISSVESFLQLHKPKFIHKNDVNNQFCFLYNKLGFSIKDIFKLYHLNPEEQKKIIVNKIKSMGYDGIKYLNLYEVSNKNKGKAYSYIVFDANQIKNCEVISFKNGKIVPLEERFNKNTNNLFEVNSKKEF